MLTERGERIVQEAKQKGMWIYDPSYKKWYTPEDFAHIFHFAHADDAFINGLQIKHPTEGIEKGFAVLSELQNKMTVFCKRVIEYYKR